MFLARTLIMWIVFFGKNVTLVKWACCPHLRMFTLHTVQSTSMCIVVLKETAFLPGSLCRQACVRRWRTRWRSRPRTHRSSRPSTESCRTASSPERVEILFLLDEQGVAFWEKKIRMSVKWSLTLITHLSSGRIIRNIFVCFHSAQYRHRNFLKVSYIIFLKPNKLKKNFL